ncbi:MAG: hypothetical protein AB1491_00355 [Thermodesulfobacteriota bacterium]
MKKSFHLAHTEVPVSKTAGEIMTLLGQKGAKQILTEYEDGEVVALSFLIYHGQKEISFRLPVRWEKCLEAMERTQTRRSQTNPEQARRTAWRLVFHWLQAQFALMDVGMIDLVEAMLPHIRVGDQTFYERLLDSNLKLLEVK